MHFSKLVSLVLSAGALSASASPVYARSPYAVKERHAVPQAWSKVGRAAKSDLVNLQIGLKQKNEGMVERHLIEVSDPGHSRYGQHLSAAEIDSIVSPTVETVGLVREWLHAHDVTSYSSSPSNDWIYVVVPIEKAEQLLQTEYSIFKHNDGSTVSRAPEWSLPLELHEHIDVVQPTTSFFRPGAHTVEPKPLMDRPNHGMSWWKGHGQRGYGHGVS